MRRGTSALVFVVFTALSVAACGSQDEPSAEATQATEESTGHVSRETMGDSWPLTIASGELSCEGSGGVGAVYFTSDEGTSYYVNGIAKGQHPAGTHDIREIWADDPAIGGVKTNIGPLIDRGLTLC
jgi:hypothetical protein